VPFVSDLHPEFGYMGSGPNVRRKVGLVIIFMIFGLVAGLSGITVFMARPDSDPMQAMALAPAEALIPLPARPAESPAAVPTSVQRSIKAARIKPPPCRENAMENLAGDCSPARAAKPVPAANERPAISAIAIGHPAEPASPVSPQPAVAVAATTPEGAAQAETPEAAPAPVTEAPPSASPPAAVKRARPPRSHHVQRRDYAPARSSNYYQNGGYARVW
jgi:translation initiation factor IF-2